MQLIIESTRLAVDVIRSHRLRSALVVVGVAIGVSALLMMVSILRGLGGAIERDIAAADPTVVYVAKFDFLAGQPDERLLARPEVTPDDVAALRLACESVAIADYYIEPQQFVPTYASYAGRRTRPISVIGGGEYFHHFYATELAAGRLLGPLDVERRRRVCVLGSGPATTLFGDENGVGRDIRIGDQRYEVVGVYAPRRSLAGGVSEAYVLVPHTTYAKDWKRESDMSYAMLTAIDGRTSADLTREARSVMRARRGLEPDEDDDFAIVSSAAVEQLVARITRPMALVLVLISSVGLMVGGIGVMNIMLVSVTERTHEIGIRRAVGATREAVMTQIVIESSCLTLVGGIVGTLLGITAATGISAATGLPSSVSPWLILSAIAFSMTIGVVCGWYPAQRAASVDPIASIRMA